MSSTRRMVSASRCLLLLNDEVSKRGRGWWVAFTDSHGRVVIS